MHSNPSRNAESRYRLNSREGEIGRPNTLRINNTSKSPEEVAKAIKDAFGL